jgi:hypothetical protein
MPGAPPLGGADGPDHPFRTPPLADGSSGASGRGDVDRWPVDEKSDVGCSAGAGTRCRPGVLPGEHGVENGVLGLADRGVREVDGPGGVGLRVFRLVLGSFGVALSLALIGPLANLGEVVLPGALNAFTPRPRLLGCRGGLAASEVRYLIARWPVPR